jgi:hypothetical protein
MEAVASGKVSPAATVFKEVAAFLSTWPIQKSCNSDQFFFSTKRWK